MREMLDIEKRTLVEVRQKAVSLTIFRGVLADEVGCSFVALIDRLTSGIESDTIIAAAYGHLFSLLAGEAELYRGKTIGDAWQNHLLDRLVSDENAFSRKAEAAAWDEMGQSLIAAVRHDLRALQSLFYLDAGFIAGAVDQAAPEGGSTILAGLPRWDSFKGLGKRGDSSTPATGLKEKLAQSDDWGRLAEDLAEYHREAGVGIFAAFRAFRWVQRDGKGVLEGIAFPDPIRLDQLVGYDLERELLLQNTRYFLSGFPANNVLLYGDRGTGKSSTVKALLNEYAGQGLRLVEVPKQHLDDFPQMLSLLRERRERFVIFVDDLSFEDNETHYKELKAVLEGSLEARPANVLLYATSNRRHLIREKFGDRHEKSDEEIRPGDTFEEKLSLSDRFGITITFISPNQERYLDIVHRLAAQRQLSIAADELDFRARQWATRHNGRSGRTARQFVDFLTGEIGTTDERR